MKVSTSHGSLPFLHRITACHLQHILLSPRRFSASTFSWYKKKQPKKRCWRLFRIQRSNEKPLKIPWFSHVFTGVRVVVSLLFQIPPEEVMNSCRWAVATGATVVIWTMKSLLVNDRILNSWLILLIFFIDIIGYLWHILIPIHIYTLIHYMIRDVVTAQTFYPDRELSIAP